MFKLRHYIQILLLVLSTSCTSVVTTQPVKPDVFWLKVKDEGPTFDAGQFGPYWILARCKDYSARCRL